MTTPAHESLCRKCGQCCRVVVRGFDGIRRHTGERCPYLGALSNLCIVYERRHEQWQGRPFDCLTIDEAIKARSLPNDCPYVQGVDGYRCEVRDE